MGICSHCCQKQDEKVIETNYQNAIPQYQVLANAQEAKEKFQFQKQEVEQDLNQRSQSQIRTETNSVMETQQLVIKSEDKTEEKEISQGNQSESENSQQEEPTIEQKELKFQKVIIQQPTITETRIEIIQSQKVEIDIIERLKKEVIKEKQRFLEENELLQKVLNIKGEKPMPAGSL